MTFQSFNTEIQLDLTRQELTQLKPDYCNEKVFTVFVDQKPVYEVRDNHISRDLLQIFKAAFPGRVGYVKSDNYQKERAWAKIGGRLFHVGERIVNGSNRAYITVMSNLHNEEEHKQNVVKIKELLESEGIPIAKGICTVTFVEEC